MLSISLIFFVFAALFLIFCFCARRVVAGVDSDDENTTTPVDPIGSSGKSEGKVIKLAADQLQELVETRARELLDARVSAARSSRLPIDDAGSRDKLGSRGVEKCIEAGTTSVPRYSEIAHVAFKSPQPLFNQNPIVWFEILEQQFNVAHIERETTKYSHAVSALDACLHDQFASLITRDKGKTPYTTFKQEVIRGLGESEKKKLHNLLHGLTLGDSKPSQLLEKLRLNAGGKFNDDSIRQLWMARRRSKCKWFYRRLRATSL